ncbi:MAG: GNAT family protein [Solirubrobacterales bacterium]
MDAPAASPLPIETERLLLRPFEPGDLDVLARLHGDADLVRWIPWGPRTREETAAVLERKMACTTMDEEGPGLGTAVVVKETGEMVGDFVLMYESAEHSVAEIGYLLVPSAQGKGYAVEACRALLGLAFDDLGFHRVIARLEARNVASATVAERLGMRCEARFVENEWFKGEWQSELIYAILAREWEQGGSEVRE